MMYMGTILINIYSIDMFHRDVNVYFYVFPPNESQDSIFSFVKGVAGSSGSPRNWCMSSHESVPEGHHLYTWYI